MSKPRILMTGATGFLGRFLRPRLAESFDVVALSRGASANLRGDLTQWNCGLDESPEGPFAGVLHAAGLYDLDATSEECFFHNVVATSHALKLCQDVDAPVFLNVSSVAAGINAKLPTVRPYDVHMGTPFPDAYSESKAQAEMMIRNWTGGPRLRVNLRPGVIVGSTDGSAITRIDGPYHAPEVFQQLRAMIEAFPGTLPLPGSEDRRIPLIPVDVCADAIARVTEWAVKTEETGYVSHHLVPKRGLAVNELYEAVLERLSFKNRKFHLVNVLPDFVLKKASNMLLSFPENELTYLLNFPRYDASELDLLLGVDWCPEFSIYQDAFWSGYEKFISNR